MEYISALYARYGTGLLITYVACFLYCMVGMFMFALGAVSLYVRKHFPKVPAEPSDTVMGDLNREDMSAGREHLKACLLCLLLISDRYFCFLIFLILHFLASQAFTLVTTKQRLFGAAYIRARDIFVALECLAFFALNCLLLSLAFAGV